MVDRLKRNLLFDHPTKSDSALPYSLVLVFRLVSDASHLWISTLPADSAAISASLRHV